MYKNNNRGPNTEPCGTPQEGVGGGEGLNRDVNPPMC